MIKRLRWIISPFREGGEFLHFSGNGAGKSTTINILCTILKKTEGEVEIFSHKLGKEDDKIREKIGIVFRTRCWTMY